MANYLYKTVIWKDTAKVKDPEPDNATNLSDFETNHKSSVLMVDNIIPAETTFEVWEDYSDFESYIDDVDFFWSDVRCIEDGNSYELTIMSNTAL